MKIVFKVKIKTSEGTLLVAKSIQTAANAEMEGASKMIKPCQFDKLMKNLATWAKMTEEICKNSWLDNCQGVLKKCKNCAIGKAKQKKVRIEEPKEKVLRQVVKFIQTCLKVVNPKEKG